MACFESAPTRSRDHGAVAQVDGFGSGGMLTGGWLDAIGAARRSLGAEGIQPRGVRKRVLEITKQWKKENKERKMQKLTEWWEETKDGGQHEHRLCNCRGAISSWSSGGLKVRCGVAFASQEGIHGADG